MIERETGLKQFWHGELAQFWQANSVEDIYQTPDGLNVYYCKVGFEQCDKLIILSPGRIESYLKYKEVIYDLFQQGYAVLAIDHRGQGQSSRETADQELGFVIDFSSYADDLYLITQQADIFNRFKTVYCLAHSMGAAIMIDYLYRYQPNIQACALSAPMLGINTGGFSHHQALWITRLLTYIYSPNWSPKYMFGQSRYARKIFTNNELCSSSTRFELGQDVLAQKSIQLGGVSINWLCQALQKISWLRQNTQWLPCPVLLLQAEQDVIVCNQGQDDWYENAQAEQKTVTKVCVQQAKHEILMEQDEIRSAALQHIFQFFTDN